MIFTTGSRLALAPVLITAATTALAASEIRINQVGYLPGDGKQATLMTTMSSLPAGTHFTVRNSGNATVLDAAIGAKGPAWNAGYPATYTLDFSALTTPGIYTIAIGAPDSGTSPRFTIGQGSALYRPLLANTVTFYRAQRDGADVDSSVLKRKPSHLTDEKAAEYLPPQYQGEHLIGDLQPVGKKRDVSGGWFDAGDYLKFVQTASYVDAILYLTARENSSLPAGQLQPLIAEAQFGSDWLQKMWDDKTGTLFYQVGIGNGRKGITGDHDLWRLPENDDKLKVKPGDADYFIKYRPAFRAAAAGSPVSPNLAGRLAASFALCAMVVKSAADAKTCAAAAEHVYKLADTAPTSLLSVSPRSFYPETAWQDDLELGAVELYFMAKRRHTQRPASDYLMEAAQWAHAYIHSRFEGGNSLNLYDVSPLAHLELIAAIDDAGNPSGLAVTRADLVSEVATVLRQAAARAAKDPFRSGWPYGNNGYDHATHVLGYAVTAELFQQRTGITTYAQFGQDQRDWLLGRNAWGTSLVIGAGTTFPQCPQHQIANLKGSLDGKRPILLGAVVNGPAVASDLKGLDSQDGQRRCPSDNSNGFAPFDTTQTRYVDNVVAWPTVEPAIDYTALSAFLFARLGQ